MPGILPMKVIKVGAGAQSRIAQACDRCRSKKIRCDGVTPCCSQCATVGFECKTSDKLSRRAFPRGYTESLEERVRALEGEVKELKDLLDEKDEKIDILSKIHSNSPQKRHSISASPVPAVEVTVAVPQKKEDTFRVQQSPFLLNDEKAKSCFMGASSGRAFFDALKGKIQESGKSCSNFSGKIFSASSITTSSDPEPSGDSMPSNKIPPRLVSDQLINIFFQEWAPLFPILHRPTFLKLYGDYTANPESIKDKQAIAQLHLVFGIAGLSVESNKDTVASSESQWQPALDSLLSEKSVATLQCLVLAQLYCVCKADYGKLLHYNGVAVAFAHRLGLHQSQKRFTLGALSRETRKKVFWSLYTLDCFSAALMGLPRLLKDDDIHTEYPSDVDDENVTERGFQPTLPGESTRVSSALALFRMARIMAKVLGEIYPSASSHDVSLETISSLSNELDSWRDDLATHLRLKFVQDKPSTDLVSSRSPLLSLAYYYIRTLIHRPAVTSSLGSKASSSMVALADSSKHIIQITQLLEERHMSFSMCLNKNEIVLLAGFSLLFQGIDLNQEGKLIQDNHKLVRSVIEILEHNNSSGAATFKKIAFSMISNEQHAKSTTLKDNQRLQRKDYSKGMLAPQAGSKPRKQQLQAITSCCSLGANEPGKQGCTSSRWSTAPNLAVSDLAHYSPNSSQTTLASTQSDPTTMRAHSDPHLLQPRIRTPPVEKPNLDYLSFSNDPLVPSAYATDSNRSTELLEWEHLLDYIDTSQSPSHENHRTSYVESSSNSLTTFYIDGASPSGIHDWSPEVWGELNSLPAPAQSVFSFSEESLTSSEDISSCELGAEYRGILIPNLEGLEALDGHFGL